MTIATVTNFYSKRKADPCLPLLAELNEFKDSNPGISQFASSDLEIHHKIPLAGKPLKTRRHLDQLNNIE